MRKYKKDYKLVLKTQPNGKVKEEAEYIGNYYISQLSAEELKRVKVRHFALSLCSVIILTLVGFLNNLGSRILYVALPYVCLFPPSVFSIIGTMRFLMVGEKLEFVDYDKTRNRVRKSTIGIIVIAVLTIIGDVFLIFNRQPIEKLQVEFIFLTGIILVLILNAFFLYVQKQEIYNIKEEEDYEEN